ncbi:DegT/DnrJ/EryC1/StrS family aminotransferase [Verrucomicrobia bacterium]|nr:DegT/DnrJ/EryC1/StrS family aminotransferase [Verrucomicrobiota bacterium]
MPVKLSKCSITETEIEAVKKVLQKEYLGMGREVQLFENKIKKYLDTSYDVVCVSSGTAALHLSLGALDLEPGDEILVPSITYVATFQAISAAGGIPVPCEVNPNTLFIDAKDAESRITCKTKAIMPVHHSSSSKGIKQIYNIGERYNLRIIEDAAQAFGSLRDDIKIGNVGDVICFSFDGIKNITSGEGGAIVSGDNKLISRVRDGRLLGMKKESLNRYKSKRNWDFEVTNQGFRYHMSDIMAAIGISQLSRIEDFALRRREIVRLYIDGLQGIKEIELFDLSYNEIIPHIFVIKAENRDDLKVYLENCGVETGIHYKPNHHLEKYRSKYILPITDGIYKTIISLPIHFDLKEEEQLFVIKKLHEFYNL